jgi:hypothetical protein
VLGVQISNPSNDLTRDALGVALLDHNQRVSRLEYKKRVIMPSKRSAKQSVIKRLSLVTIQKNNSAHKQAPRRLVSSPRVTPVYDME